MANLLDLWLVTVSIGVAMMASAVAASSGGKAHLWVTGGVISLGAGLWALQFIGMLALGLPIPMSYDVPITLIALLLAVLVAGFALCTANVALERRTRELSAANVALEKQTGELSTANVLLLQQIQERVQAEHALRETEERFRAAFEQAGVGMGLRAIDPCHPRWLRVNQKLCDILGYTREELLVGPSFAELVLPDEQNSAIDYHEKLLRGEIANYSREHRCVRKDGQSIWADITLSAVNGRDGRPTHLISVIQDVTARKQAAEQLNNHLAKHDMLTNLPNRDLFRDRMVHAMARAKRNGTMMALMVLDFDRFKEINDTLGHAIGDRVLQAVAGILKESLRQVDTIARLGSDEFTLILEDVAQADQAAALAERILQIFSKPLVIDGREIYVTASTGITLYPHDVDSVDALLQTADIAMHHAKEEGGNSYEFYVPEMGEHAAADLDMENLLRRALEQQEFTLHYQPKVSVKSGRITGIEALLRWNSKELGSISPAKFIPLAEKTGLIVPIGEWVLRTACAQNKAWQEQGLPPLLLSVNLSMRQFRQKNLLEMITAALRDSGLKPCFLELEITESMIMLRPEKAIALLRQVHQLGVQLSVDDFGTGYSSLAYLKRFPVQKLKIDQSFMQDLTVDRDDAGIVTAVVAMAKSLGLKVVAEGVETAEQLAFLAKLECDEYQGYYFSRPVPASELTRLFHTTDDSARLSTPQLVTGARFCLSR